MYGVGWPPFPYHFTSRWAAKGRPQQFHCRRREWLVERHPTMRRHAAKTWARCVADWGRICRRRAWRVRHTPECGVGQRASNQSKPAGGQAQCCTTSPKQNKEQAQLSRCPMRIQWRADAHESAISPCFEWALCPHHDFLMSCVAVQFSGLFNTRTFSFFVSAPLHNNSTSRTALLQASAVFRELPNVNKALTWFTKRKTCGIGWALCHLDNV